MLKVTRISEDQFMITGLPNNKEEIREEAYKLSKKRLGAKK